MKTIITFFLLCIAFGFQTISVSAKSPSEIVADRIRALNEGNIENFLEFHAENIQVYDYPDLPIGKPGKAHLNRVFKPLFKEKQIQTEVHHIIENGEYVLVHETTTRIGKVHDYFSIYKVVDSLITEIRFIRTEAK